MKFLIYLLVGIVLIGVVLFSLKKRFGSPFSVSLYFAPKRTGKSLDIIKQAFHYHKKGWTVFITDKELFDTLSSDLWFVYYLPFETVGEWNTKILPWCSVILCDEMGLVAHKRGFGNKKQNEFMDHFRKFLKLSGHYGVSVVLYSQCVDLDRSIIENSDNLYQMHKYFSVFTYTKKIKKDTILTHDSDGQGTLADDFQYEPFFVAGSRKLTFIPRWCKYYDSFVKPSTEYLDLSELERVENRLTDCHNPKN